MTALPTPVVALLTVLAGLGFGSVCCAALCAVTAVLQLRRLRRDHCAVETALSDLFAVAGGGFGELDARLDEAIGRLTVLTVESAGGYESDTFAHVGAAGRERLEAATAGAI